ncbi:MAG: protein kinase [Aeromicrobium sp.]|uniref:protein kinase domain-containing protein n=1 Tax=Aeromicrobium sp. TaxID=1871063 RepID=UPI0039E59612
MSDDEPTELDAGASGHEPTELDTPDGHTEPTQMDGGPRGEPTAVIRRALPEPLAAEYEIVRLLGRGGQAEVYLCRHRENDDQVAVKLYTTPNHRLNASITQVIENTADEHILRTRFGQWGDEQWEVQEYVEHGTLAELPQRHGGRLDADTLHTVVRELTTAVEHAHARQLIHRDIKPTNILIRSLDPLDLVLADFGLARELIAGAEAGSTSHSIGYASPETLRGEHDFPSDWWAVGITLYEVHQNRYPFAEPDGRRWNDARIIAHLMQSDVDLSPFDDRWRLLLRGLLTKDPQHRWTARQVTEWLAGGSPAVHTPLAPTAEADWTLVAPGWGTFATPQEFGEALIDQWEQAGGFLSGRGASTVRTALSKTSYAEASRVILDGGHGVDGTVFELSLLLAPDRPPTFRGVELTSAGLDQVATEAGHGDARAVDWVRALRRDHILQHTMGHPDHATFVAVDVELDQLWSEVARLHEQLTAAQAQYFAQVDQRARGVAPQPITPLFDQTYDLLEGELLRSCLSPDYAAARHRYSQDHTQVSRTVASWATPVLDQLRGDRPAPVTDLIGPALLAAAELDGANVHDAIAHHARGERAAALSRTRAQRRDAAGDRLFSNGCLGILYLIGAFVGFVMTETGSGSDTFDWDAALDMAIAAGIGLAVALVVAWITDAFLPRPPVVAVATGAPLGFWAGWLVLMDDGAWGAPAVGAAIGYAIAAAAAFYLSSLNLAPDLTRPVPQTVERAYGWLEAARWPLAFVAPPTMLWSVSWASRSALAEAVEELRAEAWPWVRTVYGWTGDFSVVHSGGAALSWAVPAGLALFVMATWETGRRRPVTALHLAVIVTASFFALLGLLLLWPVYLTGAIILGGIVGGIALVLAIIASY